MITADQLREKIEAHREDGGDTEILELALYALTAKEALEEYSGDGNGEYGCGCCAGPSAGTLAREALAKFPKGAT